MLGGVEREQGGGQSRTATQSPAGRPVSVILHVVVQRLCISIVHLPMFFVALSTTLYNDSYQSKQNNRHKNRHVFKKG